MASHPFHEHKLTKVDTRRVYSRYSGCWICDCCRKHFNGKIEDEAHSFHCQKCEFDLCKECYEGSLHILHHHRLQPAKPLLCYSQTKGYRSWECDACMKLFNLMDVSLASLSSVVEQPSSILMFCCLQMSWHCSKCQFDLCPDCKDGSNLTGWQVLCFIMSRFRLQLFMLMNKL